MTQGEAKVFETELVLLTVKTENEETVRVNSETETLELMKRTFKIDVNKRFARLRRNSKKRSASIF